MPAGRRTLSPCDEAIREFLAVVGQDRSDTEGSGLVQFLQEAPGVGSALAGIDTHEHPAGGAINGHKQVTPRGFVRHLRQVLHIDVDEAGLVGLERLGPGAIHAQCLARRHSMAFEHAVQGSA